jgi:hypothetical protein
LGIQETGSPISVQLGISVEQTEGVQLQLQQSVQQTPPKTVINNVSTNDLTTLAMKLVDNLFNYASSFEKPITAPVGVTIAVIQAIPTEVLKKWFTIMAEKIQKNPEWWRNS